MSSKRKYEGCNEQYLKGNMRDAMSSKRRYEGCNGQ